MPSNWREYGVAPPALHNTRIEMRSQPMGQSGQQEAARVKRAVQAQPENAEGVSPQREP
jgi:hypothetical protein